MTRITVQGLGLVGGFGSGVDAFSQALAASISRRSALEVPTGAGPVLLEAFRADASPLKELIASRVLRRMDFFTRLGLLGARLALADAGLEPAGLEGLGMVMASGHGATASTYALLDSMINDGDPCSSPTHFAGSLHSSCAGNIAIALGSTGPNLTVSQFELSVPSALLTARQWLLDGRVERVLFGAVDELSDLTGYLWYRQHGGLPPAALRPLRTGEDTAMAGEGAAFLLLSRREEAQAGYCTLEEVALGRDLPRPDGQDLLVLAADGRPATGAHYARAARGARIACYTPLYGSSPMAPAFDLAAAALMLKAGIIHPTPGGASCDFQAEVALPGPLRAQRIQCLALDGTGGSGRAALGRLA
jgi:3-oxoacyl-[acyl-carrier-protein] synthase II